MSHVDATILHLLSSESTCANLKNESIPASIAPCLVLVFGEDTGGMTPDVEINILQMKARVSMSNNMGCTSVDLQPAPAACVHRVAIED